MGNDKAINVIIVGAYLVRKSTGSTLNIKIEPTKDYDSVKKMVRKNYPGWEFTDYEVSIK